MRRRQNPRSRTLHTLHWPKWATCTSWLRHGEHVRCRTLTASVRLVSVPVCPCVVVRLCRFNTAHERSLRPQRGTPEKAPNIADIVDEVGVPGASFGTTLQDFEESKRIRDTAAAEVAATEGLGLEEGVSIEDYLKNLGVTVSSRRPGSSVAGGGHAEAAKTHTARVIPPPEPLPVSPRLPPPPLPPSSDEETDVRR